MKTKKKNKAELKPEPWHEIQKKFIKELQIEAISNDIDLLAMLEKADISYTTWRNHRILKTPMKLSTMIGLAGLVGKNVVPLLTEKLIETTDEQAQ